MIKLQAPKATDQKPIETLLDVAFGNDRYNKTSYCYRQNLDACHFLSMVAHDRGKLVGTIQYWPIIIGTNASPAMLLGPVAVCPNRRGEGIGVLLIKTTLAKAKSVGVKRVVLVGDEGYYRQFGFQPAVDYNLIMPGEPDRLMALALVGGDLDDATGVIKHIHDGAAVLVGN